ncbi:hypothetical protein CXU10_04895 [Akkermansia muciniphila]|jgi:RHS repeat-associated protein|uniref:RHS repeat-associated core domain-containing protein n=1 Tax=Akkermansia TaxID=239934 RepID=UPI000C9A61DB|nr:RHS repeat-associated core domain-containing protein [Akkermansia muciniphila]PNC38441.1 hypothetical protein CXU10_04895 [Akkermansia muciniphila]
MRTAFTIVSANSGIEHAQSVQWSSEMNDGKLALVYYNYRYYNPADGRWINRDPIAEEGGWNLYAFVGNDPIKNIDRADYFLIV